VAGGGGRKGKGRVRAKAAAVQPAHPVAHRRRDYRTAGGPRPIYEVRADGRGVIYRVLFAPQGKRKQVFLSLEAFKKKTQRTPSPAIALAKRRLADWERRGE
jgi:phage-related protein